MLRLLEEQAK